MVLPLLLLVSILLAGGAEAKKPKKSWSRISSLEELVHKQNEVLMEAAGLAKQGNFVEAATLLKEFTGRVDGLDKSGGLGSNLLNTMGEYYRVAKEPDAAEEAFEAALAAIKGFQGKEDDPKEMVKARSMVDAAEMYRARGNIARLREAEEDHEGYIEQYKLVLHESEVNEYKAMAAKEIGVYHMRLEELELGKAYLEFALELSPAVPRGYSNLGLLLHKLDELDEAEEAFLQAIKLEPDNANSYANLGTLYAQSGEVLDAEKYFKLALERDPKHRDAAQKLAALKEMEEEEAVEGREALPKFRSPMKKVGGERREKIKYDL